MMQFSKTNRSIILSTGLLACSVFLFVVALAYFDSHAAALLNQENSGKWMVFICAIPVLIITSFIYRIFIHRSAPSPRLTLSVIVGIPVSLLATISILSYLHQ